MDLRQVTRAELRELSNAERKRYVEEVWRRCRTCDQLGCAGPSDETCLICQGTGWVLVVQYCADVIDAKYRLVDEGPPD